VLIGTAPFIAADDELKSNRYQSKGDAVDIKSEMMATVWQISVDVGDAVPAGATLMVLESMKMEFPVEAPTAGTVTGVLVAEGDAVTEGQIVVTMD
jgi:biotin carboxyl carrier protein